MKVSSCPVSSDPVTNQSVIIKHFKSAVLCVLSPINCLLAYYFLGWLYFPLLA